MTWVHIPRHVWINSLLHNPSGMIPEHILKWRDADHMNIGSPPSKNSLQLHLAGQWMMHFCVSFITAKSHENSLSLKSFYTTQALPPDNPWECCCNERLTARRYYVLLRQGTSQSVEKIASRPTGVNCQSGLLENSSAGQTIEVLLHICDCPWMETNPKHHTQGEIQEHCETSHMIYHYMLQVDLWFDEMLL